MEHPVVDSAYCLSGERRNKYSLVVGNDSLMRGSHIADYCSRLRSDSNKTRKVKKSDYYPQLSGMSYHCLNAVV